MASHTNTQEYPIELNLTGHSGSCHKAGKTLHAPALSRSLSLSLSLYLNTNFSSEPDTAGNYVS